MLIFDIYPKSKHNNKNKYSEVKSMSKAFSNLLKRIDKLPLTQKEQVYHWVKRYVQPSSSDSGHLINEMRETRFKEGFECPHCKSEHVVRFGEYNGRQRYRCKSCNKTFTDTKSNDGKHVKYLDNYLAWFIFVDSRSNESTRHNIKEFLLTSFVFEMTETYVSLRKSKFNA